MWVQYLLNVSLTCNKQNFLIDDVTISRKNKSENISGFIIHKTETLLVEKSFILIIAADKKMSRTSFDTDSLKSQLSFWCLEFSQKNQLENSNSCPSLLGQKFFVGFLGELKKLKCPFQIN